METVLMAMIFAVYATLLKQQRNKGMNGTLTLTSAMLVLYQLLYQLSDKGQLWAGRYVCQW